jgi:hypothetical protein
MGRTPEPVRQGAVWRASVHYASCTLGSPSRTSKDFSVYPVVSCCSTLVMKRKSSRIYVEVTVAMKGAVAVALEVFDVWVIGYHRRRHNIRYLRWSCLTHRP